MDVFSKYLDPRFTLKERLRRAFDELRVSASEREIITAFLEPLHLKDAITYTHYEHSIRVGLVVRRIARFMHLDEKALFYAGLLHDIGKCQVCPETLGKTEGWTKEDARVMEKHVIDSYRFLRSRFDFTAEIIVLHHRFQAAGYPIKLPSHLHEYSEGTKATIMMYGRILALADVYDALHRVNDKFGTRQALSGEEIKVKMLEFSADQHRLILELYDTEIFTTSLIADDNTAQPEFDKHDKLYECIWGHTSSWRTPRETGRQIMLAAALEPLSDKGGCTTRLRNITEFQKLEYFIAGAINIGEAFESLCALIIADNGSQPSVIYNYALRAQQESKRNRCGGRVNQGIIELLMPIVVAQYLYDSDNHFSVNEVLTHGVNVLKRTSVRDVRYLQEMKRFAFDLSGHFDRVVPDYPDVKNVYEYYGRDLENSTNDTSRAHNREFVDGFPTIQEAYGAFISSLAPGLSNKAADVYQQIANLHAENVASGFLADCIAVALYLQLSLDSRLKLIS